MFLVSCLKAIAWNVQYLAVTTQLSSESLIGQYFVISFFITKTINTDSTSQLQPFSQISVTPSGTIYSPHMWFLLRVWTQSRSNFFFTRRRLPADHLQRFSARLTTSFNLNYRNGAQGEKSVSLILEIQLPSLQDTKNDSHKENKFSEAITVVVRVAISPRWDGCRWCAFTSSHTSGHSTKTFSGT